ncbi:MAG: GatB/YqeY domain-containing protein [bacterium]|nr:GatB/YqeY domain-containing protein [bacterium]
MNLSERINADMKEAMKAGDKLKLETLRMMRAAVIEFEKNGSGNAMEAADELKIVSNAAKKRKDAIEMYDKHGRTESADKERAELEIINGYMPAMMSDDDVRAELRSIIEQQGLTSPSDVGKVMGAAMKTLKGKVDGTAVQRLAKELLGAS